MQYISHYFSPLGRLLLAADDLGLTGLWFDGQKYYARNLEQTAQEAETPLLRDTKQWLDLYFSGQTPHFDLPLHLIGTPFQQEVWSILRAIPYGTTRTYGDIASELARKRGIPHLSAQAVGGAVGQNPISILIPCHRVVGKNGNLTGYAGGLDRKTALLTLEGTNSPPTAPPFQK